MDFDGLDKYRYCFLNTVFVDNDGGNKAFSVVLADDSFRKIAAVQVELDTLKQFSERFQVTDFDFSDGYFRCNPNVSQKKFNDLVAKCMNRMVTEEHGSYTFFDLLYEGQQNGFCVINDEYVRRLSGNRASLNAEDNGSVIQLDAFGNAEIQPENDFYYLSHFRMIQFSQSSMTAYIRMRNSGGCYNKMLVIPEKHVPKLQPFYFVVPVSYKFQRAGCEFLQKIELDGEVYRLFRVSLISIYETHTILAGPIVNKAMSLRQRCYNACEALSSFRRETWRSMYEGAAQEDKLKWVGGNKDYREIYGIRFKSSLKSVTRSDRDLLCGKVVDEMIRGGMSFEDFKRKITQSPMGSIEKYICISVAVALAYSAQNDGIDLLEATSQVINSQRDKLFLCDLYLYRVRLYLYVSGESIIGNLERPFLCGGNETAFTIVEGGRYYGSV